MKAGVRGEGVSQDTRRCNHCTVSPVPDHCPSVPLVPGCGEIFEEDHLIRCVCVCSGRVEGVACLMAVLRVQV